jgi:hypothetical protein
MGSESIKKKQGILCMCSGLLFLSGIIVFGMVAFLNASSQLGSGITNTEDLKNVDWTKTMSQAGSALLVICALGAIGTGVMGLLIARCQYRIFIMCYGCGLGTSAILMFGVGVAFASSASFIPDLSQAICTPKDGSTTFAYQKASSADTGMLDLLNLNMCSTTCPCSDDVKAKFSE